MAVRRSLESRGYKSWAAADDCSVLTSRLHAYSHMHDCAEEGGKWRGRRSEGEAISAICLAVEEI
jgi:hypothetical protein